VSHESRKKALAIFEAALDVPRKERTPWIDQACGGDPELAAEVSSLLAAHDDAAEFLDDSLTSPHLPSAIQPFVHRAILPGMQLGDFFIEQQIGAGGMGVVYRARQISLNRPVAIKVLTPHLRSSESARTRFQREVEASARLRHQNIVAVYTTGEDDGTAYYAMELIEGSTLNHSLEELRHRPPRDLASALSINARKNRLDESTHAKAGDRTESPDGETASVDLSSVVKADGYFATAAKLMAHVADGVAYAHSMGVIHRDIKPSNLLLSRDGEIHISDFGLARLAEEPDLTRTGDLLGTPYYMAPEQISEALGTIDERTDIYALGATLYEMLTLRRPFLGDNREQVISKILHGTVPALRSINRLVPRDLETICIKAMEKDPSRRYGSAAGLAEDLRRFIDGRPILARRTGIVGNGIRWARRHRAWSAAMVAICTSLILAVFFAYRSQVAEARWTDAEFGRVFETAQLAAIEGDLNRAGAAIGEAEKLGAPAAQLALLRGQLALQAGRHQDACDELELAVEKMPDSLAAHALLIKAYHANQQRDKSNVLASRLASLKPSTLQDYLLLGDAQKQTDIDKARAILDNAVQRHKNSVVARLARGSMLIDFATESARPADAELALDDLRIANELIEPNAVSLSRTLEAQLVSATACAAAGNLAGREQHLVQAAAAAEALKGFPNQFFSHQWRAIYFDYVGDDARALESWQAMQDHSITFLVLTLYRTGKFQEALQLCDERKARFKTARITDFLRSFVLTATCEQPQKFLAAFEPQGKETMDAANAQRFTFPTYCLAGDLVRARQISRELRQSSRSTDGELWGKIVAYNCGDLDDETLLTALQQSRPFLCDAHFFIGLTHLAEGDRDGARRHFRTSGDYKIPLSVEDHISRALLAQLDREPAWPSWIKPR